MRIILGREPVDEYCRQEVGKNALYLSEGGSLPRSRLEASIPFRDMNDWKRPGTPPYPYPKKSYIKLANDTLCLLDKPPSIEEYPLTLEGLSKIKRDNRRRMENCLKKKISELNLNETGKKHFSQTNDFNIEVKLRNLAKGKIPNSIRRYPVEFPDLQSPYKFFNEPTNAALNNGYEGYEARIRDDEHDALNCPLSIPSLEPCEDELIGLEFPIHIYTN